MHRLISWDILAMHLLTMKKEGSKEKDLAELQKLKKKFGWQVNLNFLLDSEPYDAIVVTDDQQKIVWVNEGFRGMTGYPRNFAVGKTPGFLQGPLTCPVIKQRIATGVSHKKMIREVIINYKKNRKLYHCQVSIQAIENPVNSTIHFIALEKEV